MAPALAPEWLASLPWAEAAAVMLAFACGATVGSFLNVVAHRVPQGRSVVGGGSRCPVCETRIRPRDNVPVLGWLMLGGRCRDCGSPIAGTYPTVEAACGLLLATLAVIVLAGRAGAMPAGPPLDLLFIRGDATPLEVWFGRAVPLMVLVAWGLLMGRGHRPSVRSRCVVLLLTAGAALLVPALGPPGLGVDGAPWPASGGWRAAVIAVAAGCGTGLAAEGVLGWPPGAGGAALMGAMFGWQGVAVHLVSSGVAAAARCGFGSTRSPGEGTEPGDGPTGDGRSPCGGTTAVAGVLGAGVEILAWGWIWPLWLRAVA